MEKYSFSRVSPRHKYLAPSPLQPYHPSRAALLHLTLTENYQPRRRSFPQEALLPIILPLPL